MKCPECGKNAKKQQGVRNVTDSDGYDVVERDRVCPDGHRFTTFECYEYADVEVSLRCRDLLNALTTGLKEIDAISMGVKV